MINNGDTRKSNYDINDITIEQDEIEEIKKPIADMNKEI